MLLILPPQVLLWFDFVFKLLLKEIGYYGSEKKNHPPSLQQKSIHSMW